MSTILHQLKGRWFVLDGINAVGKTTQLHKIAALLEDHGLEVLVLDEFSEGPVGRLILDIIKEKRFYSLHPERRTPYADAYAILADLLYEVEALVNPARAAGKVILSDRGLLSFCGYQGYRMEIWAGVQDAHRLLFDRAESAFLGMHTPDLHVHMTVEEEEMQRRMMERGETRLPEEDLAFLRAVDQKMHDLTGQMDAKELDTTQLNPDQVTEAIINCFLRWVSCTDVFSLTRNLNAIRETAPKPLEAVGA